MICAVIARTPARFLPRQRDPFGQPQAAAIGMPEPEGLVNQKPDGTGMHRLTAQCETLEWKRRCRRSARIKVDRSKLARERPDQATRPPIERVRLSIVRLGRALEGAPLDTAGEAKQYQRAALQRGKVRAELAGFRMECAADRETARDGAPAELIVGGHGQA